LGLGSQKTGAALTSTFQTRWICLVLAATAVGGCANNVANVKTFLNGSPERDRWVATEELWQRRAEARRARTSDFASYDDGTGTEVASYAAQPPAWSEPASTASITNDSVPLPPIPQATGSVASDRPLHPVPAPPRRKKKVSERERPIPTVKVAAVDEGPQVAPVKAIEPPKIVEAPPPPEPEPRPEKVKVEVEVEEPLSIREECLQRLADQYGKIDGPTKGPADRNETDALCALVLKRTAPPESKAPADPASKKRAQDAKPSPKTAPAGPEGVKPRALKEGSGKQQIAANEEQEEVPTLREKCLHRLVAFYGQDKLSPDNKNDNKLQLDAACAKVLKRTSEHKALAPGWRSLRKAKPEPPPPPKKTKLSFAQGWRAP
jgi:hypothetical protein